MNLRGKLITDEAGRLRVRTVKTAGYLDPDEHGRGAPAQGRDPPPLPACAWGHPEISNRGYKTSISQVHAPDDLHEHDVQFGVTQATIGAFGRHDEPHPTDSSVEKRPGTPSIARSLSSRARQAATSSYPVTSRG